MDFKEKVDLILAEKGLDQKELAHKLQLNHMVFNKNLSKNKITGDTINAFAEFMPDVDLNWLLKEQPAELKISDDLENYSNKHLEDITEAIGILERVKKKMSRK